MVAGRDGERNLPEAVDWQPLCTLRGTAQADRLTGTPGDDVICGFGGADVIRGGAGHDVIYGGDGRDVIDGGPGQDWFFGASGDDSLLARDAERDVVNGGPGIDRAQTHARLDHVEQVERTTAKPTEVVMPAQRGGPPAAMPPAGIEPAHAV